MTEPLDSERHSTQLDNAYSDTIELNRIVSSILENMIEKRLKEAPEWFKTEMNSIKSSFTNLEAKVEEVQTNLEEVETNLEAKMNEKFNSLETSLNSKFALIDSRFVSLEHNHLCVFNVVRRMFGYDAVSVPFLNREENQEELPPVLSVQDIDGLTKEQCQKYLRGYNVEFHLNETIKLKERLRDAVGLMFSSDRDYRFTPFSA
ncbi:unnamed protein product [Debaryomyces tyrocola]|nr:unnamed protein product [Debaryomyces tyrocola]